MEQRRRKKYRINYRRVVLAILLLVIIALACTFGIKTAIHKINSNTGDAVSESTNDSSKVQEEKSIPQDITIKMVATGDIMCHSTNFQAAYNSQTKEYDFSPVFVNVAKYITDADIAIRKP